MDALNTPDAALPWVKRPRVSNDVLPMSTTVGKYTPFHLTPYGKSLQFDDKWTKREWPSKRTKKAPRWCSVDLRDGNQALVNPMDHVKKKRMFLHLLELGYKEIEVGFPSASQIDFDFCRYIIDNDVIPDDAWIQVLVQCREDLIRRTIEAVKGAKNVVLHIYNSTSELQRRVVFDKDRDSIKALAVNGTKLLKNLAEVELKDQSVRLEYSPESFTGTELDFAVDVCNAVLRVWPGTPENQVIINLPATVECATPNVYADQIEWMCSHIDTRECVCVSLHPHNDRGTGVAAAEFGLLAGADRVEGCLFGNGERTGNVCLVTLAMNMLTMGIDPEVKYSNIEETISVAEYCNELKIPERWPYAGSLAPAAFPGSLLSTMEEGFPVAVGVLLEKEYGIITSSKVQLELSEAIRSSMQAEGLKTQPQQVYATFLSHYILRQQPLGLCSFKVIKEGDESTDLSCDIDTVIAQLFVKGIKTQIKGTGNGPISAFVNALNDFVLKPRAMSVALCSYTSCARRECRAQTRAEALTSRSQAVCTVLCELKTSHSAALSKHGVGMHGSTTQAALRAVISSVNANVFSLGCDFLCFFDLT